MDDVIEKKWGAAGMFNPDNADKAPYKKLGQMEQGIPKTDPAIIQCTKDILNAVWERWGRFPAFVDPCLMTIMIQAHHLECGFYDEYYREGAYGERHRRHLEKWHGKRRSGLKAA